MKTRFPFRYGIAALTEVPHLFVVCHVELDGRRGIGISAEGLPPKWFTKDPTTSFEQQDLPEMQRVIRHAAEVAVEAGECDSFFRWWQLLQENHGDWACDASIPPLLAGLGSSLLERAVLDACCRIRQRPFFQLLKSNEFGIRLGDIRAELRGMQPSDVLPDQPLPRVIVRHTVGLGDPLTPDDIAPEERLSDGLPHSLADVIRHYGVNHFKVKLCGQRDQDHDRLRRLSALLLSEVGESCRLTLDGNENFTTIEAFRDHWQHHCADAAVERLFRNCLLFVEQPIHRNQALSEGIATALDGWDQSPPMIIDESDADMGCLATAIRLGYRGTSHKNCKGVIKGLVQLASIQRFRAAGMECVLSAEDLGNVGPVALLQDLAVVSALGIPHVERNGHHYFAGLSAFPQAEQQRVLRHHADLYEASSLGFATLRIRNGLLELHSVNSAPFGVEEIPDLELFEVWAL